MKKEIEFFQITKPPECTGVVYDAKALECADNDINNFPPGNGKISVDNNCECQCPSGVWNATKNQCCANFIGEDGRCDSDPIIALNGPLYNNGNEYTPQQAFMPEIETLAEFNFCIYASDVAGQTGATKVGGPFNSFESCFQWWFSYLNPTSSSSSSSCDSDWLVFAPNAIGAPEDGKFHVCCPSGTEYLDVFSTAGPMPIGCDLLLTFISEYQCYTCATYPTYLPSSSSSSTCAGVSCLAIGEQPISPTCECMCMCPTGTTNTGVVLYQDNLICECLIIYTENESPLLNEGGEILMPD